MKATINVARVAAFDFTNNRQRKDVASSRPPLTKALRTRSGRPKRTVHASERRPPAIDTAPITSSGSPVKSPIFRNEKPRAITRYDGSHVRQK